MFQGLGVGRDKLKVTDYIVRSESDNNVLELHRGGGYS